MRDALYRWTFNFGGRKITRKASDVAENLQLYGVVWFFHPGSSCTTTHISANFQRIILSASCMTISGGNNSIYSAASLALRVIFSVSYLWNLFGSFTEPFLSPWRNISHIFVMRRPTNVKLGTRMEYYDLHHRHARWPQRSKVKVTSRIDAVTEN